MVQAVKLSFIQRLLRRAVGKYAQPTLWQNKPVHFWQRRFYDFNVNSPRKEIEKLRYIHRNPVKRGLVEKPDQWKWSSFRSYAYKEPGAVRINDWSVKPIKRRAA